MDAIDDQVTLEDDGVVDPAAGSDPADAPQEPFLAVNDRTKYATKEEAIKAFDEAGKRISGLSAWEKTAKQYGLSEPKHLETIFNETLELRKVKTELEAMKKMQAMLSEKKPANADDPKAKEAQEVRQYLKGLGYTSKEDVDAAVKELKDEIAQLKQHGSQAESQRVEEQEAQAREKLAGWLSEAKITDDENGTKQGIVGALVKNWIEGSDERLAKWSRGGSTAEKLVKEGFDEIMNHLGWKTPVQPNASAAQAASVSRRMANSRTLPTSGTARNGAAAVTEKPKAGINAATHEKAWKFMEKLAQP